MRALIDTCIIVDALQNREPFCADAQGIFLAVANNQADGFLTAKSATDIYYLTHRHTHSDKDTRAVLNTLFQLFDLLDTAGMDCRRAIRSGVDCIVTRNLKDYVKSQIPVYAPADFLNQIASE